MSDVLQAHRVNLAAAQNLRYIVHVNIQCTCIQLYAVCVAAHLFLEQS